MTQFTETLYDAWGQEFAVDRVYFEHKTDHQHLMIFHNAMFGRVMALDGIVQTTERDEFIYHEMLTHVPLFARWVSGTPAKRVLIVGGGDGGMLREVLRHKTVEEVVQVEIDQAVIDMAIEHLPNHSAGAYDDPRAKIVIADGMDYVREAAESGQEKFDVIISDSTDPIGPGEVLFTGNFYACCAQLLSENGMLATQNGVAFMQLDEVTTTASRLQPHFADTSFYTAAVPTYVGGVMTFAWGCQNSALRGVELPQLQAAFVESGIQTRYYTPAIHQASFALPAYIEQALAQAAAA